MLVLKARKGPEAEVESIQDKEIEELGLEIGIELMMFKLIEGSIVKFGDEGGNL